MLDIHFLWSRAQLRQALFCIMYWNLLGLATDTEKTVVSESPGITRIRQWWRPTRLPPTLGINSAIVFALPARPSCHPSHVFIYCEQFYNSQPLCCHLLIEDKCSHYHDLFGGHPLLLVMSLLSRFTIWQTLTCSVSASSLVTRSIICHCPGGGTLSPR